MQEVNTSPTGAIYRLFKTEVLKIRSNISIPNSICFSPDGLYAYFSDTKKQQLYCLKLNDQGTPIESPELAIDFTGTTLYPDGAVFDDKGSLYIAMWGAGCVIRYSHKFAELNRFELPVDFPTCPGIDPWHPGRLWVTSASEGCRTANRSNGRLLYLDFEKL